jgi:hypothetical protein
MARRTPRNTRPELTADQKAEADRIHAAMLQAAESDLRELAELLAAKDDSNTFGATEFTVRDIVLRLGAKAIQTALEGRKKATVFRVKPKSPPDRRPPPTATADRIGRSRWRSPGASGRPR